MTVRCATLLLLTTIAARERGEAAGDRHRLGPPVVVSTISVVDNCGPFEDLIVDVAQVRLQRVAASGGLKQPGVFGPVAECAAAYAAIPSHGGAI